METGGQHLLRFLPLSEVLSHLSCHRLGGLGLRVTAPSRSHMRYHHRRKSFSSNERARVNDPFPRVLNLH